MSRRRVPVVRIGLAVLLLGTASLLGTLTHVATSVLAAAPPDVWQVWLDEAIPSDVPPGSAVHLGFIAWNVVDHSTDSPFGFAVRLHPADGKGAATEAEVTQDWPGHSTADLVVPPSGFGRLEIGMWAASKLDSTTNSITLEFRALPVAGVGPPPDISLRLIGTVRPTPSLPVFAGQPFDVDLTFEPRVGWPAASLPLPEALTLRVRVPRADGAQDVRATLADRMAARYRATVVLDQPGAYILEAATEPDAPPAERFTETEVRVVAEPPSGPPTPAAPPKIAGPASPADQGSARPRAGSRGARDRRWRRLGRAVPARRVVGGPFLRSKPSVAN